MDTRLPLLFQLIFLMPAHATLYDRGNGLIYDDRLDITWMQDANYAMTSGYDADGLLDWYAALAWADQLVYQGFDDWRLPYVGDTPVAGGGDTGSEFGALYYLTFGLVEGTPLGQNASFANGGDSNDIRSFINVIDFHYWYGQAYPPPWSDVWAWLFHIYNGRHGAYFKTDEYHVWAVRDGDVYPTGDVTGDNQVGLADLLALQRHMVGLEPLAADAFNRADLYPDGGDDAITLADMLRLHNLLMQ